MTAILAEISGSALLNAVIWIIVAGVIYWLVMWAIDKIGVPEPFHKVLMVVVILAVLIILVNALLTIAGHPFIRW